MIDLSRNEYYFDHPKPVLKKLGTLSVCQYGTDASQRELQKQLSTLLGTPFEKTFLGHGAEDFLIKLLLWFRPKIKKTYVSEFCWHNYINLVGGFQIPLSLIPCTEEGLTFKNDLNFLRRELESSEPALVMLATPNNPSAHRISSEELEELIAAFPQHIFVIDAVYDAPQNPYFLLAVNYINCITLGSFSKFFGLPGLRVGFAVGELPQGLHLHLGLSASAIPVALETLTHFDFYLNNRRLASEALKHLQSLSLPHLKIFDSDTCFFTCKLLSSPESSIASPLLKPKHFVYRQEEYLRIALGRAEVVDKIELYLKQLK